MDFSTDQFTVGIIEFNRGAYFQAHETWERVWHKAPVSERDFYKGLIQVDVALYHHRHGNRKGAVLLLESSMALLQPYSPAFKNIDLEKLLSDCGQARKAMLADKPLEKIVLRKQAPKPVFPA
ncbi:MAG: DUF309 domain-containing protein [Desulfovibrionales bacterium]